MGDCLGYVPLPPPKRIAVLMDRVRGGWEDDTTKARQRLELVERLLDEIGLDSRYKEIYPEYEKVRAEVKWYYGLINGYLKQTEAPGIISSQTA